MTDPSPAPEPVEVADDELAAAEEWLRNAAVNPTPARLLAEYQRRRRVAEQVNDDFTEASNGWALARADLARARAFLLEATGTLPASGFTNDELGDPWVRWLERVAAYLTRSEG